MLYDIQEVPVGEGGGRESCNGQPFQRYFQLIVYRTISGTKHVQMMLFRFAWMSHYFPVVSVYRMAWDENVSYFAL